MPSCRALSLAHVHPQLSSPDVFFRPRWPFRFLSEVFCCTSLFSWTNLTDPSIPIPVCATLKRFLISPIGVLDLESLGTCSFPDIFVSHSSNLLDVSVFDPWVSLTRDTIAPDALHNFSYSAQMGRKRQQPWGLLSGR